MSHLSYEAIMQALTEGVCTLDRDLRITYFNRMAEDITGYPLREVIGLPLSHVFRPAVCQCTELATRAIAESRPLRNEPTRIQCGRDAPIPIRVSVTPVHDDDGEVIGAVMTFRDVSDVESLRKELKCELCTQDIITRNPRMRRLLDLLPHVAESESPVLVLGDSGTGKELLARAIHRLSSREKHPFIAVNCGALPDNLLESELFGYKAGAFTDAKKDKPGRFAIAEGGTLFLDEIGDISQAMQVKLLRVLQERQYEPLGAVATVATNVRIIAATNRELKAMMADGSFRSDLYYRLNVVELRLPSLSERREDIPLLVEYFIQKHNEEIGKPVRGISQAALDRLLRHDFPGNIRELQNIVERAHVICPYDEIQEECLQLDQTSGEGPRCRLKDGPFDAELLTDSELGDLPSEETKVPWTPPQAVESGWPPAPGVSPLDSRRKTLTLEQERDQIVAALKANNGHRRRSADMLGIDVSTLWRKMKKHSLI